MNKYSIAGRSVATGATANAVGTALWNPSTAKPIWVCEIKAFKTVATVDNPGLVRITARGTATLTVTPDIDNDKSRRLTPPSGALLDLTYSAQPTLADPYLERTNLPAAIGSGLIWVYPNEDDWIEVPPGTGLAIATPVAVILQPMDVTFVWKE